jgi:hypothetical protein
MAERNLFSRLNRLFSNNVVVRRIGKNRLRVIDTDRLQSHGNKSNSHPYDRYTRLHGSRTNQTNYNSVYNYHSSKQNLYADYESMDADSLINSALNIYADESTVQNEFGDVLKINSSNENIKKILHNLYYDIMNVEFNLWPWIRSFCKYGDFYLKLDIDERVGILNAVPLSAYEIIRLEGHNPENPYEVEFVHENGESVAQVHKNPSGKLIYKNYEMLHFRMLEDTNWLPYGKSRLEGTRQVWKALKLMEDAMLIHRIMRAPDKRVYKIDVGNLAPNEIDAHMEQIISKIKKVPFVDESTGEYNLKYNIQNLTEDFYLPVRGGQSGTEIDSLGGLEYTATEDIEYLLQKVFAGLVVPKAFLNYEEGTEGKATLAAMDVRFAKTIERIQRIVVSELTKAAVVHLTAQGYSDGDLVDFSLELTNPSLVYKQEQIELWNSKVSLARDMKDLRMLSDEWIYDKIFDMSKDEWELEQLRVIENLKQTFRREQIEQEGNDPAKTGKSFGTPHDIASMQISKAGEDNYVEQEYNGGRPKEGGTYGSHESNLTYDPLGKKELGNALKTDKNPIKHNYRKNSPLAYEEIIKGVRKDYNKKSKLIQESLKSDMEKDVDAGTLLDESQLLEDYKSVK